MYIHTHVNICIHTCFCHTPPRTPASEITAGVCVCIYTYAYVCVCKYVYVYVYMCMATHIHIGIYTFSIHPSPRTAASERGGGVCICIYTYLCVSECVRVYIYTHTRTFKFVHTHTSISYHCRQQSALLDGYCSTVQGLLDWFKGDLGFLELFLLRFICVLSPMGWLQLAGSIKL